MKHLYTFLFFLVILLFFGRSSLSSPFFYDDFHLIRGYSPGELLGVWMGPWDPDGAETPGFHPLTTLFYHSVNALFGDSVANHRLFLLGLFSVYLTLASALAQTLFNTSYSASLPGGLPVFLHIVNINHYLWIISGVFLLSGIFIISSILFTLESLRSGNALSLVASLLCVSIALLIREDSLISFVSLVHRRILFQPQTANQAISQAAGAICNIVGCPSRRLLAVAQPGGARRNAFEC